MNELDDIWAEMLQSAISNARSAGRGDIARYLELKATNDTLRSAGCKWLFDSFTELSETANRAGIRLDIEREEPHRFKVGHSTMVGWLMRFRFGLRALTVEAGWPRTPADGFVRGNGLAVAKLSHFGLGKADTSLILAHSKDRVPDWFIVSEIRQREKLILADLTEHFRLFLDLDE